MRKSNLKRITQQQQVAAAMGSTSEPIETNIEGLAAIIVAGREGKLNPTQREFIFASDRIGWYCGPAGCAKTSTLVAKVILACMLLPGSKALVSRAVWWALEQTTMARFKECLARLGPNIILEEIKGPPGYLKIATINPDGSPGIPSEIIFQSLDNFEKLGSIELNIVAIDEANEVERHMVETLDMRLRHKRPGQARPDGPFFLSLVSNPVRRSHWLHKAFCGEHDCQPVPMGRKFRPNPRENEQNLPPGYYEQIKSTSSPEMVLRFVEGECGPDPSGEVVFKEFRSLIHTGDLKVLRGFPMGRSFDFGRRRPACTFFQKTPAGHINRIMSVLGENESTEQFALKMKQLSNVVFYMAGDWDDICDPHGAARRSNSDLTDVDILHRCGFRPRYRDVKIKIGLDLMSEQLNKLIDGRPMAMYDKKGCSILIEGYASGYTWPVARAGQAPKEKPVADGYYEHVMDTDRYICVNTMLGSSMSHEDQPDNLRRVRSRVTGY